MGKIKVEIKNIGISKNTYRVRGYEWDMLVYQYFFDTREEAEEAAKGFIDRYK